MNDIFEKELNKETVFKDRDVLSAHYIPDTLPHREKEIERIMKTLAPSLSNKRSENLFLYGKTGTGKTSVAKHVIDKLVQVKDKYEVKVDPVYINCRIQDTKYQVILKMVEYCYPEKEFIGYAFAHLYDRVLKYIEEEGTNFIVMLDEVDKNKSLDDLIYTLTRTNDELNNGQLIIVGITNEINFKDKLDPRSRSTLCEEEVVFSPYDAEEIKEILERRIEKGFKENCIGRSAVNLVAATAAQESGDARRALMLLQKSGDIADNEGKNKVIDSHVKKARDKVEEEIVYETIETLPEHQKILLYAIAQLTNEGGHYKKLNGVDDDKTLMSGEVYSRYESLCEKRGKDPKTARWCREYIDDLDMLGLVTTNISGKGVRGNTTLIKLAYPAGKVKKVIEERFSS
ncbi:MAG: Cdc6/Cdc18 family protein [archaeon]